MQPLFSVIIAHYNSFRLMERCIASLEGQTCQNVEVIVVDDCSADDSYEHLCRWAEQTPLAVKVIRQAKNGGPGVARNTGLDHCTGKYVTFLDADDFYEVDLLEQVLPILQQGYDTVVFDATLDYPTQTFYLSMVEHRNPVGGEIDSRYAVVYVRGCTVGKVYTTDLIRQQNCRFGEYYRSEDIPFTQSCLAWGQKIFHLQKPLYHYVQEESSITHSEHERWNGSNQENTIRIIQETTKGLNLTLELEAFALRTLVGPTVFRMVHDQLTDQEIKQYIRTHYSKQSMKNPYLKQYPLSRYIMMKLFATGYMPLIRLMYNRLCK